MTKINKFQLFIIRLLFINLKNVIYQIIRNRKLIPFEINYNSIKQ